MNSHLSSGLHSCDDYVLKNPIFGFSPTKYSGLAVKRMIDCGAGVVDADYRGNVGVVLFNFGSEDFVVEIGDRIAQLILEQISMVPAVKVEELTETERGVGGFGSTGIKGEPEKKIARTISPTGEVKE